jgi:hypothetical protein
MPRLGLLVLLHHGSRHGRIRKTQNAQSAAWDSGILWSLRWCKGYFLALPLR